MLYPVLMTVPTCFKQLEIKKRNAALSRFSRNSLERSSEKSGFNLRVFEKNAAGVPLPGNGIFWSVSHKPELVAGVVSKAPVGIDVERIKPVSEALFRKIVSFDEENCFGNMDKTTVFFRSFTAKEAVLKFKGIGLKGLSNVKIIKVLDSKNIVLTFNGNSCMIENFYAGEYLASVVKNNFNVEWVFFEA